MNTKHIIASFLTLTFLFSGCESKSEIDENLVANVKNNTPEIKKFISEEFNLTTTGGKNIKLKTREDGLDFKDYKGKKVILIDVFATWCPPCIKGIPVLKSLKEKYKDDFEIVSVLFEKDKEKEEILEFIEKYKINYPITMGEENFRFAKALGDVKKIPELFLYAKDGTFIKKFVGETKKEKFEKYIDIALAVN